MLKTVTLSVEVDDEKDDSILLVSIISLKRATLSVASPAPPEVFGPIVAPYIGTGRPVTVRVLPK